MREEEGLATRQPRGSGDDRRNPRDCKPSRDQIVSSSVINPGQNVMAAPSRTPLSRAMYSHDAIPVNSLSAAYFDETRLKVFRYCPTSVNIPCRHERRNKEQKMVNNILQRTGFKKKTLPLRVKCLTRNLER